MDPSVRDEGVRGEELYGNIDSSDVVTSLSDYDYEQIIVIKA